MLRLFLPLALSLVFYPAHAQDRPDKVKGLLWEISGHGLSRPGYLYGTMHVPEKMAFNLSDSFFIALKQVDIVALETDHDQWQAFTEMLEGREDDLFGAGAFGQPEDRRSTQANLYGDLFSFPTPDNQLLGAILSAKPRMTNEFLYRSNQYRQDYEEDTYLDLFIFQAGRKLGKKVIGLETMEGSYEAFVRAQMPDDEEDDANDRRYYPGLYAGASIEDAYRDQDLSLLDSLNKMMSPGKNFQRWMQDERNLLMAQRIDSVLQSGATLFSAVGAAHLPGNMGLIRMLRQKGYTLRPVQFSARNSKSVKDSIDALHYPVQFSRQWAPDSAWSVEAPGKFYLTMEALGLQQQLCTDMGNGAYYAVYQIPTYGLWNGQNPDYIAGRIDSLIYEKIPGKIQERNRLTQPFTGHEITTRTRRGDIMRYKIFVTPMNVFLFATGGNGDYALGKEGTQFMNSIRFATAPAAAGPNVSFSPPQGGFSVRFPTPPFLNTTGDKKAGRYLVAAAEPADSAFYLLYRADFHDWEYIEEDSFELNVIGEKIAAAFTKQPPHIRPVAEKPFPVQDISFRSDRDSAFYFLRLVVNGPHYYLLGCRKHTDEAPASFFNSFAIEPVHYPDNWQEISDTTLMFRARVPADALDTTHPFLTKLRQIIVEGIRKNKKRESMYMPDQQAETRYLKLPFQGEEIVIHSNEFRNGRNMPSIDSFQLSVQKGMKKLIVREKNWYNTDPHLLRGDFLLADTNSTRGIRYRILVTPGRYYSLAATIHLDAPESAFVRTLFDSFTPTDTTGGPLPFGRPNRLYLQNIYAADSLIREKALTELEAAWYNYDTSDFPALRAALEHPAFGKLRYDARERLLSAIACTQRDEALKYLQAFFGRYPDSARYRETALLAIGRIKTRPAFETLVNKLRREPLYLSEMGLTSLFRTFDDTLELVAKMYRDFLPLAEQADYREQTLELFENLANRKLIRPAFYARIVPGLANETARLLQKLQYNTELKNDSDQNNQYRYGNYAERSPDNLGRNLRLLAPFVGKNRQVKQLFLDATRCPDKNIQTMSWCLLLKNNQAVERETLRPYYQDDRTRIHLYRQLSDAGQKAAYAAWFSDTIALAKSILLEEARDQIREQDSIRFRSSHRAIRWNRPAMLYFFEVKKKKEENWTLACLTLPANANIFGVDPETPAWKRDFMTYMDRPELNLLPELPETEKATFIRKKIGETRFANRERYREVTGGRWQ